MATIKERAIQIRDAQTANANTATLVGGVLCDIADNLEPTKHTITQVYSTDELQKVFSIASGESVIMRYSCYVSGRSWTDELYYTNTGYPCDGSFYTHYYQDFVERRKVATGDCVCIKTKNASAAPSLVMTIEVIYASGDITWYDGVTTDKTYTSVINSKVASTIDLSAATNLTTNSSGTIYNDSQKTVTSLSDDTTYTMNASASNGLFTIPARSNYSGTKIFCYGDGTATLNSVEYNYTSGQTLELNDGVVVVESNVKDYYDKDETDEKLKEITDSIPYTYNVKVTSSTSDVYKRLVLTSSAIICVWDDYGRGPIYISDTATGFKVLKTSDNNAACPIVLMQGATGVPIIYISGSSTSCYIKVVKGYLYIDDVMFTPTSNEQLSVSSDGEPTDFFIACGRVSISNSGLYWSYGFNDSTSKVSTNQSATLYTPSYTGQDFYISAHLTNTGSDEITATWKDSDSKIVGYVEVPSGKTKTLIATFKGGSWVQVKW